MLTHEQIIENIEAMESQGAQPNEIQDWLDTLPKQNSSNTQAENYKPVEDNIKSSLVPKSFSPLGNSKVGQAMSGIAKGGFEVIKDAMNTGQMLLKEKAKQDINRIIPGGTQIIDNLANKLGVSLTVPSMADTIQSKVEQNKGMAQGSLLEANTPLEKGFKTGTEIASVFMPIGETSAVGRVSNLAKNIPRENKALQLTMEELGKINGRKLDWLTKDSLSAGGTKGGIFTPKKYVMPEKIKQLTNEFIDILEGTPEKIRLNAEILGKNFKDKTLNLFNGDEKLINKQTLIKTMEKAVANDTKAVYDTTMQRSQVVKKSVKSFIDKVEVGTNKGLEEARLRWYSEAKNAQGKLSDANKVIHTVIKNTIKETLPKAKQEAYDLYKTKMAKLFDIQEIMKAKIKASEGTSKVKEFIEKAKVPTALIGAYEGGKRIITGRW